MEVYEEWRHEIGPGEATAAWRTGGMGASRHGGTTGVDESLGDHCSTMDWPKKEELLNRLRRGLAEVRPVSCEPNGTAGVWGLLEGWEAE